MLNPILEKTRAVFWDCDGVLFNTEPIHFQALQETLYCADITITLGDYNKHYIVHGDEDAIREAFRLHGKKLTDEILAYLMRFKEILTKKCLPQAKIYPGVRKLLLQLQERKTPSIIVSGSFEDEIRLMTVKHGIDDLFFGIVDVSATKHHKPRPDPYLAGLALLHAKGFSAKPAECLVIEDAEGGVRAGKTAGMRVLGVANSISEEALWSAGCDFVVNSLVKVPPTLL